MKKIVSLTLLLCLLLVQLGACAKPGQTPGPGTASGSSASAETPSAAKIPERGTWNGFIYTNDFAQLQFTLPKGWLITPDEELSSMTGQAADIFSDKKKWEDAAANQATIYDTMVRDDTTGSNVFFLFENLSKATGGTDLTEKDYWESAKKQMAGMENMKYTFGEPYNTTLGGNSYLTVRADEANNNLTQYFLLRKVGTYMVDITVTVMKDVSIDDVLGNFKK